MPDVADRDVPDSSTRRSSRPRSCMARAAPGPTASSISRHGGAGRTTSSSAPPTRTRVPGRLATAPWLSVRLRRVRSCGTGAPSSSALSRELGRRLHRDVPVPAAVVAVADQPGAGLGVHPLDVAHRQPRGERDADRGDHLRCVGLGHAGARRRRRPGAQGRDAAQRGGEPVPDLDDRPPPRPRTRGSAAPCRGTGGRRGCARSRGCRRTRRTPASPRRRRCRGRGRARRSRRSRRRGHSSCRPASRGWGWVDAVRRSGRHGSAEALGAHGAGVEAGGGEQVDHASTNEVGPQTKTAGSASTPPQASSAASTDAGSTRPGRSVTASSGVPERTASAGTSDRATGARWPRSCRRARVRRARRRTAAGRGVVTEARTTTGAVGSAARHIARKRGEPGPAADQEQRAVLAGPHEVAADRPAQLECRRRRCRAPGRWRPRRPRTSCTVIVGASPGPDDRE